MQFLSTVLAVIYLTFSAATMAAPAPQGFIGQEKCTNIGSYGCGRDNSIIVCNGAGKWVTAAYCGGAQHCGIVGGQPHCI
ncbi:hypothetical protein ONS95_006510 [Cadophora gregata]|uniref:uncharacterized protein n=1 Tax=Cadophora gregata TaxID=51156 RepID=UPI0026DAC586|nr:uncharacterized protein ONS95_006510 [Cadophora gregata]KAK0101334.1 hypothetical protein ONS95_006510 [Cadophora gregata]KAK0106655.1 hypothetical protein ONS96_004275 [Cadophora gregata f. sp. sojae]